MIRKKMILFPLILAAFTFAGCESSNDNTDNSFDTSVLVGTWTIPDSHEAGDDEELGTSDDTWYTVSFIFTANTVIYRQTECTTSDDGSKESPFIQYDSTSSFIIGEEVSTAEGAYTIDLTTVTNTAMPLTEVAAAAMNEQSFAEITSWAANVPQSIAGKTINGDVVDSAGVIQYDIIKVDGNKFYLGSDENGKDGESEANRPVVLDTQSATKQ